ncbi:hypothetical protein GP486_008563 [Trichoglossum hirsutum]|uniref:Uncharacterized protein n=1 Tax=Trichoglossum hirsutum TaxID=265104 RepID=A0A9P8L4R9_9PEZI|nr:hypothetical protein GP486_008563 [Trichoglossum hirsutum]
MSKRPHNTHALRPAEPVVEVDQDDQHFGSPMTEGEDLNDFLKEQFNVTDETLEGEIPSNAWLEEHFQTKSARIRYLYTEHSMQVKEISKKLSIRYQMVRNILTNELKRGPAEPFTLGEKGGLAPLLKAMRKPEDDE